MGEWLNKLLDLVGLAWDLFDIAWFALWILAFAAAIAGTILQLVKKRRERQQQGEKLATREESRGPGSRESR